MTVPKIKQFVYRYFTESWTFWGAGASYIQVHMVYLYIFTSSPINRHWAVIVPVVSCLHIPVPLSSPQIPHGLASADAGWWLHVSQGTASWPAPCDTQHSENCWQHHAVRYNKYPICLAVPVVGARTITTRETPGAAETTAGRPSPKRWNLSCSLWLEANVTFLTGILKQVHALMKDSTPNWRSLQWGARNTLAVHNVIIQISIQTSCLMHHYS